jgi:hypothetical protein
MVLITEFITIVTLYFFHALILLYDFKQDKKK